MHEGEKDLKRVFFIIPALHGGGAERVLLSILRYIDRSKFKPNLVLFVKKGELLSEIPPDIELVVLNSRWLILIKLAKLLREEKPDAVVSFMWYANLMSLLAGLLGRIKKGFIVCERYGLENSEEGQLAEFMRRLAIRFFYPGASLVLINSKAMGQQMESISRIPSDKLSVIYNPIDIERVKELSEEHADIEEENVPLIIAIGRLTSQKGFDILLKAFKIVHSDGIKSRLIILGKGEEEGRLKKLASELGIVDSVSLSGFVQNPYKYLVRSDLFVLSSLYEGFPNVLLEALALGVPSIATRCPTGPEEIITDGINGILVPPADEKALAEAIKRLLTDEDLRKRLGEAGKKRAEDFRVEKIIKEYEVVIENVCAQSGEGA